MSMPISVEDLARFRELRAQATQVVWGYDCHNNRGECEADSLFIHEAAKNWDALLDEITALRERIAELEGTPVMSVPRFEDLKGKTLCAITGTMGDGEMTFKTDDGERYILEHLSECCECVLVEDICGDLKDLIESEILLAEEATSRQFLERAGCDQHKAESFTWTFYKLATMKGAVTIRWFGKSTGNYSESVDFGIIASADEWRYTADTIQ